MNILYDFKKQKYTYEALKKNPAFIFYFCL
jgi:hypothetical protein